MASHTGQTLRVETSKSGVIQCDVVGELDKAKVVLMTVHDLGCNSSSWHHIVNHPSMKDVTAKSVWLHVNLPGHETGAEDLPEERQGAKYPSLDDLAQSVIEIFDKHAPCPVILIGEGAGANICARVTLLAPARLHGSVLIHCTSTTAGFSEKWEDMGINKALMKGMNPTAEHYLISHRFGDFKHAKDHHDVQKVVDEFHEQLTTTMNAKNIRGYIDSFLKRTNLAECIGELTLPILQISGAKCTHLHTVKTFHDASLQKVKDKKLVEFIIFDDIANVVEGAPAKFAQSLIFFAQGCGLLAGVPIGHATSSAGSMEAADRSDV